MALQKRGGHYFGNSQDDIRTEVVRFSNLNGYEATQFADALCNCGGRLFHLVMDEDEGAAVRTCIKCGGRHAIADSAEYLADAELEDYGCLCGEDHFEITAGISLYPASQDVRWLYIGCRCPSCGLTGVYGDWKNEYLDYRALLAKV